MSVGSGRATHAMSTAQLVEGALSYVEEGYDAIELRAGFHRPEDDVARTRAVREAVGDGVRILQPDAPLMGGVTKLARVAVVADAANVSVSPHFLPGQVVPPEGPGHGIAWSPEAPDKYAV